MDIVAVDFAREMHVFYPADPYVQIQIKQTDNSVTENRFRAFAAFVDF